jgi:Leucine-rich repeat (LRR) protein
MEEAKRRIKNIKGDTLDLSYLYLTDEDLYEIYPLFPESLKELNLCYSRISDISSVSFPASLKLLRLSDNQISDISSVSFPESLKWLNLYNNQISDISSVSFPKSLKWLVIYNNPLPKYQNSLVKIRILHKFRDSYNATKIQYFFRFVKKNKHIIMSWKNRYINIAINGNPYGKLPLKYQIYEQRKKRVYPYYAGKRYIKDIKKMEKMM